MPMEKNTLVNLGITKKIWTGVLLPGPMEKNTSDYRRMVIFMDKAITSGLVMEA